MNVLGYYPGCSLSGTAREYDLSLKAVANKLGVVLKEVPDWVCCGATSAHAIDHATTLALAADTLAKARQAGMDRVLAPCAMCYQRLAAGAKELADHPHIRETAMEAMGERRDLDAHRIHALNILQWLQELPQSAIEGLVTKPLAGLKVACYYGCLLVRPAKLTGENNVEAPRTMEKLITLLGGEPVRWTMAMECCGGSFALSNKRAVLRQGQKIVDSARKAKAEVICLACPMCQANLDMRQSEFAPNARPIPVVYLTQLMGVAMGLGKGELGFAGHFVPVDLQTK